MGRGPALFLVLVSLTGCAATLDARAHDAGVSAVTGAAGALDDPATKAKLDDLAASAAKAASAVTLSSENVKGLQQLVETLGATTRGQVVAIRDGFLQGLDVKVRPIVRDVVDEVLGKTTIAEVIDLREALVGPGFSADMGAAAVEVEARVEAKLKAASSAAAASAKADVEAELSKYKTVAIVTTALVAIMLILHSHTLRLLAKRG